MSDFLSEIHRQQIEIAEDIGVVLFYQLPTRELSYVIDFVADVFLQSDSPVSRLRKVPIEELDEMAVYATIKAELRHDTLLAVRGYTAWIAALLFQQIIPRDKPVPRLSRQAVERIAAENRLKGTMIRSVERYLMRPGTVIPPLGEVGVGHKLIIDEEMLKKYAEERRWVK